MPASAPNSVGASRRGGFTLVELLVVMAVIAILISAVVAVSTVFIEKAKARNTLGVMRVVSDAVEAFKRDRPSIVTASQPAGGADRVRWAKRYGLFPPDELDVFTDLGLPGSDTSSGSLAVGGATMSPAPLGGYPAMRFHDKAPSATDRAFEHRDNAALVMALEQYSASAAGLLAGLPTRYRAEGVIDGGTGQPLQFLDRGDAGWDADDLQVRYIVDDWKVPLGYLAQRDWNEDDPPAPSGNHPAWNRASTEIIRLNGDQPLILSYGPDGADQFTPEMMGLEDGTASLVADWEDDGKINNPLNADNLYLDAALKDRLAEGRPQ